MNKPKALVAGNWKMNGTLSSQSELEALETLIRSGSTADCDILLCPPFTLISSFANPQSAHVAIGAQDCHAKKTGAHTGDISAEMLADAGAGYIIVGHSERRADHGESSSLVKDKAQAVHSAGLIAIVCIGESDSERTAGKTADVVLGQLRDSLPSSSTAANTVVAYEPVWAIGTGKTPSTSDVADIHADIRSVLIEHFPGGGNMFRILYGGSVKAANAHELMGVANVNGALVGGASLKAADFNGIIDAYRS